MFRGSSYSMETDKDISFSNAYEQNVKIALVGMSEVGKQFMPDEEIKIQLGYRTDQWISTTLQKNQNKSSPARQFNSRNYPVNQWDCSGLRMLQYIQEKKLKNFDGLLYIYDLSNPHSVMQLEQFYDEIKKNQSEENISIVVGNKADLVAVQDQHRQQYKIPETVEAFYLASKFSERKGMIHQNISAKLNSGIADCFVLMIKEILNLKRHIRTSRMEDDESIPLIEQQVEPTCTCTWNKCIIM